MINNTIKSIIIATPTSVGSFDCVKWKSCACKHLVALCSTKDGPLLLIHSYLVYIIQFTWCTVACTSCGAIADIISQTGNSINCKPSIPQRQNIDYVGLRWDIMVNHYASTFDFCVSSVINAGKSYTRDGYWQKIEK